jgi:4-amino-4-deoxy-L-arabinose transferase-like glycosyltransferase
MRAAPFALAVLCAAVLFTGLGRVSWLDWREARDAQVAHELIDRRELVTPLLGSEPLFEKPVAAYVPEVAGHVLTPGRPVGARRLKAMLALALVVITGSIGARCLGARAGWCAAAVLATSFTLPLAARTDGTQVLATLLGWLAAGAFADSLFGRAPGRGLRLLVGWSAIAVALVVAGPLPALWPLGGLALYVVLARRPAAWRAVRPAAGSLLVLGVALPWYGAMIVRHGAEFLTHVPFLPYAIERRGAWYAGPLVALTFLVVGCFPWIALLPAAMRHAAMRWLARRRPAAAGDVVDPAEARERREENASHFFVACLLAALVPVALYPGPPLPAALPALPAAALVCGRFLDHLLEDTTRLARALAQAALMLALVGTGGALMLAAVATRARDIAPDLRLVAALVFVTAWAPFLATLLHRTRVAAALMLLPVALGTPAVSMRLLPAMSGYLSAGAVAEAMAVASPERAPLLLLEPPPPSLRLLAPRNLVVAEDLASALERFRAADGLAYVAYRPFREPDVARAAAGPLEIVLRTSSLVLARVHPP